jgi:hypothetical protein
MIGGVMALSAQDDARAWCAINDAKSWDSVEVVYATTLTCSEELDAPLVGQAAQAKAHAWTCRGGGVAREDEIES